MIRMQLQYCVFLFCVVQLVSPVNYDFIGERIECIALDKDLCKNTYCTSRPIKRYMTYFDIGCTLLTQTDNIMIRATLYYKFAEYRQFLVDTEENICDYLNHKKPSKLAEIFIPPLLNASNIRTCPFKGDIRVKDLNINDNDNKPPGLPAGQYRLDISITSDGRSVIKVKLFLTAKPKGAAKLEMG